MRESSNVQWSGGGLLVSADEDGSGAWLALRLVQARTLVLSAAHAGALLAERLESARGASTPWLQLRRRRGAFEMRWRAAADEPWRALPGSPLTHAGLGQHDQRPARCNVRERSGERHQTCRHPVTLSLRCAWRRHQQRDERLRHFRPAHILWR